MYSDIVLKLNFEKLEIISQREVVKIGRVQIFVFLAYLELVFKVEERRSIMVEDL